MISLITSHKIYVKTCLVNFTYNKAMIKSIPRSKTKIIHKNNPCWNEEFKNERRNVNKAYKSMIRSPTQPNVNRYKNKHANYKKKCNKVRLWSWRGLQQDIGSISEMNMFRKIIQSTGKVSLGTHKTSNGDYTVPGENTMWDRCYTVISSVRSTSVNLHHFEQLQRGEELSNETRSLNGTKPISQLTKLRKQSTVLKAKNRPGQMESTLLCYSIFLLKS